MLPAPGKEHLPAHSQEVCPWGATCPVHRGLTFADPDARRLPRKTLPVRKAPTRKPCFRCGGDRPEGLQLKKAGRSKRVCRACYDNRHILFGVGFPRHLKHLAVAA